MESWENLQRGLIIFADNYIDVTESIVELYAKYLDSEDQEEADEDTLNFIKAING